MNVCKPTEKQAKLISELKHTANTKIQIAEQAVSDWLAVDKPSSAAAVQQAIGNLNTVMAKNPERDVFPVYIYISMLQQHINNSWLTHTPQDPIA